MLEYSQYGEYVAGVIRPPTNSPLTGQLVRSGFVHIPLTKTHFVRVNASEWRARTPQEKADLKAEWTAQIESLETPVEEQPQADAPEFDAMTFDDLKTFAADNGYDVTGRRSTDALRAAVRTAYMTAQLTQVPVSDADAGAGGEFGSSDGDE
jgi:hypothetical protein